MKVKIMLNDTMKQTTKSPQALVFLAGAVANPLFWPVASAVGVLSLVAVLANKKKSYKANQTVSNRSEQAPNTFETVQHEPLEPYNERYEATAQEPSETVEYEFSDEEYKKELVRQAMSELGKKSGEARRRKRDMLAEHQ